MELPGITKRYPKLTYYVLLCVAVTVCFFACNALMLLSGRDLVWTTDAQPLYMNYLTWWVQETRDIVSALLAGSAVEIPDFTYSLGYGADVPMTMGSYVQEPLNVIALAFPTASLAIPYAIMTWLRMFLSAVAFSEYCFYHGHGRKATAVAALAYATCGYALFWGMLRHPKFIDWAVLIPFIFQGADRLFDKRGHVMLCVAFALQFFIAVYTAYMSCLALLIYCVIRYFAYPRNRSIRDFAVLVIEFIGTVFLAFLIAALFTLPQVGALLSQGRATSGSETESLNTIKYYLKIPVQFIGGNVTTNSLVIGALPTIGVIAFLLGGKHLPKERRRPWLIALTLCAFGVLFPFVGHVFNGMGYSTDRWGLLIGFVCAYILCLVIPVLPELSRREWKHIGVVSGVVALVAGVFAVGQVFTEDGLSGVVWPLCMTAAFVVVFLIVIWVFRKRTMRFASSALCAIVIVCAAGTCCFYCSPLGDNWVVMFGKAGSITSRIDGSGPAGPIDEIDDTGVFRFSYPCVYDGMKNSALTHGTMAVDFYSSFYNQRIDDFRQELGISDHYANISFVGSDSRLALDALAGVKYYVIEEGEGEWRLPYSFEDTGLQKGEYRVYETAHYAPLAYTMKSAITHDEYEALSMSQKQEALLQAVVLDQDDLVAEYRGDDLEYSAQSVPFEVEDAKGLEFEEGVFRASKKGARATLVFKGLPNAETYVSISNLDAVSYAPDQAEGGNASSASPVDFIKQIGYRENREYPISFTMNDNMKKITYASDKHVRSGGKKDWLVNMGYNEQAQTRVEVKFSEAGVYSFDDLQIVCQPAEPMVARIDALSESALEDLKLETDRMSATLDMAEDDPVIAVFMVAHAPGWSVKVDGEQADVLNADTGFLAVEVKGAGKHSVEWFYANPYAKYGLYLSVLGVAIALCLLAVRAIVARKRSAAPSGSSSS